MLFLIRGLPGSGKSTMARSMVEQNPDMCHYEADMYFVDDDGDYYFDGSLIGDAHEWCQNCTFLSLYEGKKVVVSNTFTRIKEMQPYFDICEELGLPEPVIIEAEGNYGSIHDVPEHVIENMRNRWEVLA